MKWGLSGSVSTVLGLRQKSCEFDPGSWQLLGERGSSLSCNSNDPNYQAQGDSLVTLSTQLAKTVPVPTKTIGICIATVSSYQLCL